MQNNKIKNKHHKQKLHSFALCDMKLIFALDLICKIVSLYIDEWELLLHIFKSKIRPTLKNYEFNENYCFFFAYPKDTRQLVKFVPLNKF